MAVVVPHCPEGSSFTYPHLEQMLAYAKTLQKIQARHSESLLATPRQVISDTSSLDLSDDSQKSCSTSVPKSGFNNFMRNPLRMTIADDSKRNNIRNIKQLKKISAKKYSSDESIPHSRNSTILNDTESIRKESANGSVGNISPTEEERTFLNNLAERSMLREILCSEKVEKLWRLRKFINRVPSLLPIFIENVKWNNRDQVSQLYVLLQFWCKTGDTVTEKSNTNTSLYQRSIQPVMCSADNVSHHLPLSVCIGDVS